MPETGDRDCIAFASASSALTDSGLNEREKGGFLGLLFAAGISRFGRGSDAMLIQGEQIRMKINNRNIR